MKILSKKETGMGGSWILADYGNNFLHTDIYKIRKDF